ncbi:hypothetical protein EDC04DRAFT_2006178 [Pisolithus marmoratus]|nr:hypothetical protein EDC04DRAFT_2006178 [Pisolithus marmoratus]
MSSSTHGVCHFLPYFPDSPSPLTYHNPRRFDTGRSQYKLRHMPLSMEEVQMNGWTCFPMWLHQHMVRFPSQGVLQSVSTSRRSARTRIQQRYDTAIGSTSILGNHIYARTSRSAVPRLFSCDIFIHDIIPRTVPPQPGSSDTCGLSAPSNPLKWQDPSRHSRRAGDLREVLPRFCCSRVDWLSTRGSFSHSNPVSFTSLPVSVPVAPNKPYCTTSLGQISR